MPLTYEQVSILGSCLGVNVYGACQNKQKKNKDRILPTKFHRNRFCLFPGGNTNYGLLSDLEKEGLTEQAELQIGDKLIWFFVTDVGKTEFRKYFKLLMLNSSDL